METRPPQFSPVKRVNVRFSVPYYTQWGQNLIVCGSDDLLGKGSSAQGQSMTPHHEGDSLVWEAQISAADCFETRYKYCLVDESKNPIKWEAGEWRVFALPEGLPNGSTVDVHDSWQVGFLSNPAFRPSSSWELGRRIGHVS